MNIEDNIITADAGKVFRRKIDGILFGKEIYLGLTYYLNGGKLETPIQEKPDDFEEIDIEIETEEIN
ncbi:hypothetical protein [Chryseobacterium balustinum]|uniref:hypothetical protein n=1 Tax=Chryseobacterium balustinum TaxID=246 RepID=UPI003CE7732F